MDTNGANDTISLDSETFGPTRWDDLKYWQCGEWQVIQEKLDDLDRQGILYNPPRHLLFHSLDRVPLANVKVLIIGQDPYPDRSYCTGIAFNIPPNATTFPPTLLTLLKEYSDDLHYPFPTTGDLTRWCDQGVLLWNAVPSCLTGKSLSHDWGEWRYLTQELVDICARRNCVICYLGSVAKRYKVPVDATESCISLSYSHPAAERYGKKFGGTRMFTTINGGLCTLGHSPINWRLD